MSLIMSRYTGMVPNCLIFHYPVEEHLGSNNIPNFSKWLNFPLNVQNNNHSSQLEHFVLHSYYSKLVPLSNHIPHTVIVQCIVLVKRN